MGAGPHGQGERLLTNPPHHTPVWRPYSTVTRTGPRSVRATAASNSVGRQLMLIAIHLLLLALLRRGTRLYARLACAFLPRLPHEGPNTRLYARLACVERPRLLRQLQLQCRRRRPLDQDANSTCCSTICSANCTTKSNRSANCRFAEHRCGTLYELANPMPSLW